MGKSLKLKEVKKEKKEIFENNQNLYLLNSINDENVISIAKLKIDE
jgi:hypothetical protein